MAYAIILHWTGPLNSRPGDVDVKQDQKGSKPQDAGVELVV